MALLVMLENVVSCEAASKISKLVISQELAASSKAALPSRRPPVQLLWHMHAHTPQCAYLMHRHEYFAIATRHPAGSPSGHCAAALEASCTC
jgi:hypothetical protein